MLKRRAFLFLLMTSLAGGFAVAGTGSAMAKDGDGGGDGGNDGGGDGGNDGGGDDGGKGGGDDSGKDDDGGDSGKGDDGGDSGKGDDDGDKIRAAVKRGDAESLGKILPAVRRKYPGKVIRIQLAGKGSRLTYRIRVISRDNKLIEVRVNAQSGKIMGVYNL